MFMGNISLKAAMPSIRSSRDLCLHIVNSPIINSLMEYAISTNRSWFLPSRIAYLQSKIVCCYAGFVNMAARKRNALSVTTQIELVLNVSPP